MNQGTRSLIVLFLLAGLAVSASAYQAFIVRGKVELKQANGSVLVQRS